MSHPFDRYIEAHCAANQPPVPQMGWGKMPMSADEALAAASAPPPTIQPIRMPPRPFYQEPVVDEAAGIRNFERVFGPGSHGQMLKTREQQALEGLKKSFQEMTDDQRLEWIDANFPHCRYCGKFDGAGCNCMRDD